MEENLENYEESDDLDSLANISNVLAEHDELEMLMPFYAIGIQNARWNEHNNAKVTPLFYSFTLSPQYYLHYSITIFLKGKGDFSSSF